jgi:hypothetical protein
MRLTILAILAVISLTAQAQKKILIESKDEIIEMAAKELTLAMQPPEGSLYLFKQEFNIKGEYIFDITIREKGEVASVFVAGNEGGTIQQQNLVKDKVKNFEFSFKMPKGKTYKFQYILNFDKAESTRSEP